MDMDDDRKNKALKEAKTMRIGSGHSKPYSTATRHASLALALARPCWRRPCGDAKWASQAGHECALRAREEDDGDGDGDRGCLRGADRRAACVGSSLSSALESAEATASQAFRFRDGDDGGFSEENSLQRRASHQFRTRRMRMR